MKHILGLTALAAVLSAPLLVAPAAAHASCQERRVAGTVIGGVGGALVGHAIFGGALGTVAGGLGGAVAGHQIAGSGCHRNYQRSYYAPSQSSYGPSRSYGTSHSYASNDRYHQAQPVYYNQYGRPIGQGNTQVASYQSSYNSGRQGGCPVRTQSYYDAQGSLRQQSVQDCSR